MYKSETMLDGRQAAWTTDIKQRTDTGGQLIQKVISSERKESDTGTAAAMGEWYQGLQGKRWWDHPAPQAGNWVLRGVEACCPEELTIIEGNG